MSLTNVTKRAAILLAICVGLAACTGEPPRERAPDAAADREPSSTTPGISISGHATIGVIRTF
ncbi:MAG: hypothetical protein ACFB11_22710 [Paracoccaceae bacterium]